VGGRASGWIRGCAAVLLAVTSLGGVDIATAAAACAPPDKIVFQDPENKNTITYLPASRRVEFALADGRRLEAENALALVSARFVNMSARNQTVTITMRADLRNGRVSAALVERLPGYGVVQRDGKTNRSGPNPNRRTYVISVRRGDPQGLDCIAGPNKPPTGTPRNR
jgi:hypothetical protein